MDSDQNEQREEHRPGVVGRKPYTPPAILTREPLEVLAAVCDSAGGGKQTIGVAGCIFFTQS